MAQKDSVQCNHLLDFLSLVFFHSDTSKVLGCSRQRDTGHLCDSVGKGVGLMPCYGDTPQQQKKDREDMFCAASIRAGLDLCPMGDCTGFFSFLGLAAFVQSTMPAVQC